jgi:hypothetical protein
MDHMPLKPNTILGSIDLTVEIHELKTANLTAQQVISLLYSASNITSLFLSTDLADGEEDDDTDPSQSSRSAARKRKDEEAARLTEPITQILSAITSTGGSLSHFTWRTPNSTSSRFTRPPAFWVALYAHAPTIQSLQLDFFEHEVSTLPIPPIAFPALTDLKLDTCSAHGDDGSSIQLLLKACSATLQSLDFEWPRCDLSSCQLQNVDWSQLSFKHLTNLSLNGWDFDSASLAGFLARHSTVTVFRDAVEGPYCEDGIQVLERTTLPKLCTLYKHHADARTLAEYFDPDAHRPIKHLALSLGYRAGEKIGELAALEAAGKRLEVLELYGEVRDWRIEEDKASSDDENDERKQRQEKEVNVRAPQALETWLSHFTALQELGINLESGGVIFRQSDGKWGCAKPAAEQDLVRSLSLSLFYLCI